MIKRPKSSGRLRSVRSSHGGISENIERVEELICSHESALHICKKIRTKLKGRWTFHGCLFGALQSTILGRKSTSACQGYCHSTDGAALLSNVVSNKLRWLVCQICCRFQNYF